MCHSRVIDKIKYVTTASTVAFINQVFNEILVIRLAGWRAGGRILNGVKLRFPLNNFS